MTDGSQKKVHGAVETETEEGRGSRRRSRLVEPGEESEEG
jgi:hypothetical protein